MSLDHLLEGHKRFLEKGFDAQLAYGQKPKTLVIACSDSRVDPAIIFDTKPGELFVVRNIANLAPPYTPNKDHHGTSAALEFAVKALKVSDIIILGHTHCGGILALMEESELCQDFVPHWMEIAKPARARVLEKYPTASLEEKSAYCEKESLLDSMKNLKTYPWITKAVEAGNLKLHAWYFDLKTGNLDKISQYAPCYN